MVVCIVSLEETKHHISRFFWTKKNNHFGGGTYQLQDLVVDVNACMVDKTYKAGYTRRQAQ